MKQQKSQATSPNLPQAATAEFQPTTQHNEITTCHNNSNESSENNNQTIVNVVTKANTTNNGALNTTVSEIKKDDYKPAHQSAITVMNYGPSYSTIENGTTVYPTTNNTSFSAYQQGVSIFISF